MYKSLLIVISTLFISACQDARTPNVIIDKYNQVELIKEESDQTSKNNPEEDKSEKNKDKEEIMQPEITATGVTVNESNSTPLQVSQVTPDINEPTYQKNLNESTPKPPPEEVELENSYQAEDYDTEKGQDRLDEWGYDTYEDKGSTDHVVSNEDTTYNSEEDLYVVEEETKQPQTIQAEEYINEYSNKEQDIQVEEDIKENSTMQEYSNTEQNTTENSESFDENNEFIQLSSQTENTKEQEDDYNTSYNYNQEENPTPTTDGEKHNDSSKDNSNRSFEDTSDYLPYYSLEVKEETINLMIYNFSNHQIKKIKFVKKDREKANCKTGKSIQIAKHEYNFGLLKATISNKKDIKKISKKLLVCFYMKDGRVLQSEK